MNNVRFMDDKRTFATNPYRDFTLVGESSDFGIVAGVIMMIHEKKAGTCPNSTHSRVAQEVMHS